MRKASLAVALLAFAALPLKQAQASGRDGNRQQPASAKGVNLAGQVSKDGKTLMAEDDNVWSVSNPGMLRGFEGRQVTVKCRMDPDKHAIRVLNIIEPGKSYSNYLRDSAFRR